MSLGFIQVRLQLKCVHVLIMFY